MTFILLVAIDEPGVGSSFSLLVNLCVVAEESAWLGPRVDIRSSRSVGRSDGARSGVGTLTPLFGNTPLSRDGGVPANRP